MGTSTSVAQLTGKLNKLADELGNTKAPLEATALRGKQIFLGAAGGNIGVKPQGKRKPVGARYDFNNRKATGLGQGAVVITYTGPAHLINNRTSKHFIGARRLGSRRRLSRLSERVGATAAFGGSNVGAFGGLAAAQRITRSGAIRSGGKAALTIPGAPDSGLRAYAFHPGTTGKHFFEKAKAICERTLPQVYARKGLTEPLRRTFH